MGIGITEEHRALAQAVRGGLARAVPPQEVRALLDADPPPEPRARPPHWDALALQGLPGIHLPEEYGGGGGGLLDLAVVLEEAAHASLPGPFAATVLTSAVLHRAVASAPHQEGDGLRDLVKALAAGDLTGAAALDTGTLTAVESEGGHVLDGAAPPVLGGAQADLLLLAATSATGTLWFAVDAGTEGLTVRPHGSVDPTRPTAEVHAGGVRVPAHRTVATDTASVRDLAAVLLAADACGTAARSLHTASEYAKVREQFGRPIGQFQAVKHLCADMLVRLEQARALTWDAARASDETPDVRGMTAALAAATALDAAYTCAKDCIQILGGIGFTWEHDAHLQLRRAVVARQLLGGGDAHRLRAVRLAGSGGRHRRPGAAGRRGPDAAGGGRRAPR